MTEDQFRYKQLMYQKDTLEETKRANLAKETETSTHNRATEGIDMGKLNETIRHDVAGEAETAQHNRATEAIDMGKLNETIRSNVARETIDMGDLNERIRHNEVSEFETQRHDLESEQDSHDQAYAAIQKAESYVQKAQTEADYKEFEQMLEKMEYDHKVLMDNRNYKLSKKKLNNEINEYKLHKATATSSEARQWVSTITKSAGDVLNIAKKLIIG